MKFPTATVTLTQPLTAKMIDSEYNIGDLDELPLDEANTNKLLNAVLSSKIGAYAYGFADCDIIVLSAQRVYDRKCEHNLVQALKSFQEMMLATGSPRTDVNKKVLDLMREANTKLVGVQR